MREINYNDYAHDSSNPYAYVHLMKGEIDIYYREEKSLSRSVWLVTNEYGEYDDHAEDTLIITDSLEKALDFATVWINLNDDCYVDYNECVNITEVTLI